MKRAMATMTAEEFLARGFSDETRWEQLIEGQIVVGEPTFLHGELLTRILVALRAWSASPPGFGSAHIPADVLLDRHNVYAPDVLWYSEVRDLRSQPPYSVPDLAVEVCSPSTWRYDMSAKKDGYERVGLPELWVVDVKAHEVLVFRRSHARAEDFDEALTLTGGDALTSPQLPGFALSVAELFAV